jgi:Rrf2 family protein
MRLTAKTSYAIRALIDLAIMYPGKRPVSIKDISAEEGISSTYLEQIFNRLKNAGIVKSVRGPRGGYVLAKPPVKISVYSAITALEGEVSSVGCRYGRAKGASCDQACRCASKEVWDEVTRQIQRTLESFSLGYLAGKAVEKDPGKLGRKGL